MRSARWSSRWTRPVPRCITATTSATGAARCARRRGHPAALRGLGPAWWGWTAWDWARSAGRTRPAFRAAQPLPTETTVRPVHGRAGAYLLGGFTDFHQPGQLQPASPGPPDLRRDRRRGARSAGPARCWTGGATAPARDDATGCRVCLPGPAAQPQPAAGGPGPPRRSTAPRAHPATCPARSGRAARAAAGRRRPGLLRPAGAPRLQPRSRHRRRRPGLGRWVERWHATSTLTPEGPRHRPRPSWPRPGAGWPPSTPRSPNPASGPGDLRGLGRRGRPDDRRRLRPAPRRPQRPRRQPPIAPRTKAAHPHGQPATFFRDCQEWEWIARRFDPQPGAGRCRAASPP